MPTQVFAGAAAQTPQPRPTAPPPWPQQPQPQPTGAHRGPWLIIAVLVLALAVGGAGVAIALSKNGSDRVKLAANTATVTAPADTTPSTSSATAPTTSEEAQTDPSDGAEQPPDSTTSSGETGEPNNGLLPSEPSSQMQQDIQRMLLEWHEDVVSSNYQGAWDLLSQRKQQQSTAEYGYAGWVKNQATLKPYLDPSGLTVSVQSTAPSTGVARVDITGMRWDKPGADCSEWSGITWVKYEVGSWRYDPGYSTTPQREAEWKPRYAELLGGQC
jgi:hypothetical protein